MSNDITDRARVLTNQILGGSGDYLQIHVKAAFDVDIKNTDETTALIAAALQLERDEASVNIQGQPFSAQEIFDMYTEASSARYEAIERAEKAEGEAKALREAAYPFARAFEEHGRFQYEGLAKDDFKLAAINDRNQITPSGVTMGDFRRLADAVARAALQSQGGES
jgi:hypothetical protein